MNIHIQGEIFWKIGQDEKLHKWVGICDEFKIVLQAETEIELKESMDEALDALFLELYHTGDLDHFLKQHGFEEGVVTLTDSPDSTADEHNLKAPLKTRIQRVSSDDLAACLH